MKKFILVILLALLLAGCGSKQHENWETIVCEDGTEIYARKFVYDKHQYIEFRDLGRNTTSAGFVHDPDCWCMIEYD